MNYKNKFLTIILAICGTSGIVKPMSEPAAAAMVLGAGAVGGGLATLLYKDMKAEGNFKTPLKNHLAQGAVVGVGLLYMAIMYRMISDFLPSNMAQKGFDLLEKLNQVNLPENSTKEAIETFVKKSYFPLKKIEEKMYGVLRDAQEAERLCMQTVEDHSSSARKIRALLGKADLSDLGFKGHRQAATLVSQVTKIVDFITEFKTKQSSIGSK